MKYIPSLMNTLVKQTPELQARLKQLKKEMDLEQSFALKALYHSEVADNGRYQRDYQDLENNK